MLCGWSDAIFIIRKCPVKPSFYAARLHRGYKILFLTRACLGFFVSIYVSPIGKLVKLKAVNLTFIRLIYLQISQPFRMKIRLKLVLAFLCLFSIHSFAQIKLPKPISDGMVLQRDQELKIWGWASPKAKIKLTLKGEKYTSKVDEKGNWHINLSPQKAGGPYVININEVSIQDVYFGDVWICSGQSNMVLNMERLKENYPHEIASANYPEIRNYFIKTSTNLVGQQQDLNDGHWETISPETVLNMSGVAFFFARDIHKTQKVPVGIINASVGGTPIQAWISEKGLKNFPELMATIENNKDTSTINKAERERLAAIIPYVSKDKGMLESPKWFENNYQAKNWGTLDIPGFWEDQGLKDLNGVVWYRKEIDVPAHMAGTPANLYMGRIVDADIAYVNGEKIGNITYQYPPRRYNIRANLLKEGKNTIVIRVTNDGNKGGFVPDKKYILVANGDTLDVTGTWHYKVGEVFEPKNPLLPELPRFVAQNQPSALFNAMAAPLTSFKAKGFIWNQGESNTAEPAPYGSYLKALIEDWRNLWGQGNLPFLVVQLANFMDQDMLPVESNWAQLREEQRSALKLPNTALAAAIDLGEWNDIHPLNKKDVGLRLAKAARKLAYNESIVYSGPNYTSHKREGSKIILSFEHIGSGLISIDNEPLRQFAIAGFDKKFIWADAKILGDKIEVSNAEISHPLYVRYAWANNPEGANLYNKEGLPAIPFQSNAPAEESMLWHGKKAAVILTYDDALNVHLDNAIPALNERDLKGTFYLTAFSDASKNRIPEWRKAASQGHELGNHTLNHPCDASKPGRSWVAAENDLSTYNTTEILREIRMTNVYLEAIDGQKERTFAYTCGDTETGEGSFMEAIKDDFVASRGVRGQLNKIGNINLLNVDCYGVNGETGEQLIQWVKNAEAENALLTILFHGVGGEHALNVSLEAHTQLLDYLEKNKPDIWTTTMIDAAKHVKDHQK
jgi:sialate O-acetylesterase